MSTITQRYDFEDGLRALKLVERQAQAHLNAIVWIMLMTHDTGLGHSDKDWVRLREAQDALEAADRAVTQYCITTVEEVANV